MTLESCAWWSFYVNILADFAEELDELAGAQDSAKRSNIKSNEAFTPPKAPNLPFVPPAKDLFTRFMKVFMEMTQAQTEPQERFLKARTPEIY